MSGSLCESRDRAQSGRLLRGVRCQARRKTVPRPSTASEFGEIPRLFQNSTGGCQVAERDYRNRSSETGCFRSAQCAKTHSRNKSCKSLIPGPRSRFCLGDMLMSVWLIIWFVQNQKRNGSANCKSGYKKIHLSGCARSAML
jgi:hypothetical protein